MNSTKTDENALSALNILVVILSIYVLCALLLDTFVKLPIQISRVLDLLDNVICVFFLFEFSYRFYKADKKIKFMKFGWIDLVASIPTFDFLRVGRALRLIRLLRVLRAFRSTKHIVNFVLRNRVKGTFTSVAIIAILMLIFSAISILMVENDPNSNIKTAEDAIWWAYVTITTVGYGDKFPVTTEGKVIAALLMTTGVGLFGTFTGFLASWFVEGKKE